MDLLDKFTINLNKNNKGYTFIELILVVAIISILISFIIINLSTSKERASMSSQVTTIIADLKTQQLKSMVGDTSGTGTISTYGIHFYTDHYDLFHGTYTQGNSSNFTVQLDTSLNLSSITLPSSEIDFNNGDGSVTNFVAGQNTITVQDTTSGNQKTITINQWGTILSVN